MKILLIYPSQLKDNGKKLRSKSGLFFNRFSLPMLAAVTPQNHQVEIVNDYHSDIDYNSDADLVGISSLTVEAPRAYQIAQEFKKRGKIVIMGGVHATLLPQEAKQYVDSVVIGEAEILWPKILEDIKRNQLKDFYKAEQLCDLDKLPWPRLDLLKLHEQNPFYPIIGSRGCYFDCDFCSVTTIYGRTFRHRSVKSIIEEISQHRDKIITFLDDNTIADYNFAKELFIALRPLKVEWSAQVSINIAQHDELLDLAKKGGCGALNFGIESINQNNLDSINKKVNQADQLEKSLKKIKAKGINILLSFIFGFDDDDASSFKKTLKFLKRVEADAAYFHILTPYPGTRLYQRLKQEGRIITEDWSKYSGDYCVFKPKKISPKQLKREVKKIYRKFYSPVYTFKRIIIDSNQYRAAKIIIYFTSVRRLHIVLPSLFRFLRKCLALGLIKR